MKKETVLFTCVQDCICTGIKNEKAKSKVHNNIIIQVKKYFLKLKINQFYPETLKEHSLNVLGYFYVPNC